MRRLFENREAADFLKKTLMPGPYQCYLCGEEDVIGEDGLCDVCRRELKSCPNPTYLAPLDGMTVGLQYGEKISSAVIRFKKYNQREYARFFSQFLSVPEEWHADILVPVPMHLFKKWLRGFNHSELLAAYLSGVAKIPFSTQLLYKTKFGVEQKKLRSPSERRKNMRGSFLADPHVKGLRIVLVDDVFTTGATVYECAKTLKLAGAEKVYLSAVTSPSC